MRASGDETTLQVSEYSWRAVLYAFISFSRNLISGGFFRARRERQPPPGSRIDGLGRGHNQEGLSGAAVRVLRDGADGQQHGGNSGDGDDHGTHRIRRISRRVRTGASTILIKKLPFNTLLFSEFHREPSRASSASYVEARIGKRARRLL